MEKCTPQGKSEYDSLPEANLYNLKLYLVQLFPFLSRPDFEGYWKGCLNSIEQAWKGGTQNQEQEIFQKWSCIHIFSLQIIIMKIPYV